MFYFSGNYCPVCHKCYEENDYESEVSSIFNRNVILGFNYFKVN